MTYTFDELRIFLAHRLWRDVDIGDDEVLRGIARRFEQARRHHRAAADDVGALEAGDLRCLADDLRRRGDEDRQVEHARLLGGDAGQHRPHVDIGRRHRLFGDHFPTEFLEVVGGGLGQLRGVGLPS